jgi:hypothetical protein
VTPGPVGSDVVVVCGGAEDGAKVALVAIVVVVDRALVEFPQAEIKPLIAMQPATRVIYVHPRRVFAIRGD